MKHLEQSIAGVVLCGGRSTRMGVAKATLPLGPETLLQRVARLLGSVAQPLVVVAAEGQRLPDLPDTVRITRDRERDLGPLEGIRGGLAALPPGTRACYVTSCDVPMLNPAVVRFLHERLEDYDVVVPTEDRFYHPLSAVYRSGLLTVIDDLLAAGQRRPVALYERVRTCRVPVETIRSVDPSLDTLWNLNRPEDYYQAAQRLGWTVPSEIVKRLTQSSPE